MTHPSSDPLRLRHRRIVTFLTLVRAPFSLLAAGLALCHAAWPHAAWLAAVLLGLAFSALTDLFDGKLARRWNVVSRFGKLADPLMDKVFFVATLPVAVFLAMRQGDLAHAGVLLALDVTSMLRDQWVSFLRSAGSPYGAEVAANWWGKFRTAMAFPVTVVLYLYLGLVSLGVAMPMDLGPLFRGWVIALEVLLLAAVVLSGWIYTRQYLPYLRRAMEE